MDFNLFSLGVGGFSTYKGASPRALGIRPGGWRTISTGSTVQTPCARQGLALGGGLTTVPVDPTPPCPLAAGPSECPARREMLSPTVAGENRSPADQVAGTTSSFKVKKAVVPKSPSGSCAQRICRGVKQASPSGLAKPALCSSSFRARTCSFGRGVGLGRQSTGSCMHLPHPSVFWRSARGLPDAPHVRMDKSRFGENPPLDCYCYIF